MKLMLLHFTREKDLGVIACAGLFQLVKDKVGLSSGQVAPGYM